MVQSAGKYGVNIIARRKRHIVGIFRYRARNNHAELFTGKITAENIHVAALQIRSKGLWVVQLEEELPRLSWQERIKAFLMQDISIPGLSAGLGRKEEVLFLSQLSYMLQAGLPLQQALCAMGKYGAQGAYQELKKQMEHDVSAGRTLFESMARYPQVFSETVRASVKAGEKSGALGDIMKQLSSHMKNRLKTQEKLKSALVYPSILLAMMVISMFIVAVFILPAFADLLKNIEGDLPWTTAVLLEASDFFGNSRGRLLFCGLFLMVLAGIAVLFQEPRCRLQIDKMLLSLPALGKLVMHLEWLQILETLAVLLKSGLQLSESLKMVKSVPRNSYLRECLEKIQRKVEQGQTFTDSLTLCRYVPWQARELMAAGEEAGCLEEMLFESASICQEQAGQESERMLALVEPSLTLIVGFVLLFLIMAIIMPVLNVMDVLT